MADAGFLTNRELFSNHYLTRLLPETEAWEDVDEERLSEAANEIKAIYDDSLLSEYNEDQLRNNVLDPVFEILGLTIETEETLSTGRRRPDYAFFEGEEARQSAFSRREDGDFYADAIAVGDAKYWDRPLDTRGKNERDFGNPSYQIHVYLDSTGLDWGILTNGRKWRLYYGPTSHKLDSYYEIDLPELLSEGTDEFKYFYLFFRREAFVSDTSGSSFLDRVRERSNTFAQELGEDVQENIYEAIPILAEGFLSNSDLDSGDLDLVHDAALTYLYRLIFVLYAESEGRELLETDNRIYSRDYSLNTLKREVTDELDSASPGYTDWQTHLWDRLDDLFYLIDRGSEAQGIPREELYVPAYNGGLFSTEPGPGDRPEASFLQEYSVGDSYLARVIELLTRRESVEGSGRTFVDYSSLDIRHLGSIYEGLLEYELNLADEALVAVRENGDEQWVSKAEFDGDEGGSPVEKIEAGTVYLTTEKGERKATGSYYTPEYVVQYIVEETLDPLLEEIREDLLARDQWGRSGGETNVAEAFAERVFELKILDPAMGSGHFLTNAIDHLARAIVEAQEKQADLAGEETVDESHDIHWARRQVAQQCIYGVDLNDMAVELAKVSLWLRTLAAEQPLAFLDHHLKTGNSLVGSDIEEIEGLESSGKTDAGPNRALTEFGIAQKGTIEHLMGIYQEFVAIENRELADAKEMERKYREIEQDTLRNRLVGMANVHTAEKFDVEVPGGAYERMGEAINDEAAWSDIENTEWYRDSQRYARESRYLHWKLEFPEVFYQGDGSEKANPGFDAVIGNPPYGASFTKIDQNYLDEKYTIRGIEFDSYAFFIELAIRLLRDSGETGYIVPTVWTRLENNKNLREFIMRETTIRELIDCGKIFQSHGKTPIVETLILIASKKTDSSLTSVKMTNKDGSIEDRLLQIHNQNWQKEYNIDQAHFQGNEFSEIDYNTADPKIRELVNNIETKSTKLDEIADTAQGITAYDRRAGQSDAIVENRAYHSRTKEDDTYGKWLKGSNIGRYEINWSGEWLSYGDWLVFPREKRFFSEERLLFREVTGGENRIIASYSDDLYYYGHSIIPVVITTESISEHELLAIANSKLLSWYHWIRSPNAQKSVFPKMNPSDVGKFQLLLTSSATTTKAP